MPRSAPVVRLLSIGCAALLLAACNREPASPSQAGSSAAVQSAGEVNLYTTREPGLIQPLLDAFTASTGIAVNTVFLKDGLMERLSAEGERSAADVLMTVDTGNLLDVVNAGHAQPVESSVLAEAVPAHLRGEDRAHQRPRAGDRCKMMTEEHEAVGRHVVEPVVAADRGRPAGGVGPEDRGRDEAAIETVGDGIDADRGDHDPERVHRLAAMERENGQGQRAKHGQSRPGHPP